MSSIQLQIITPKKIVLEREIASVTLPSADGEITVLPHHIKLFSLLNEGIITIRSTDEEEYMAIGGGYVETDGKSMKILVSRAYKQDEIDQELTEKAIESAKKALEETKDEDQKIEAASLLRRSIIDMKLLKKRKRSATI